jgi:hypothetical protein
VRGTVQRVGIESDLIRFIPARAGNGTPTVTRRGECLSGQGNRAWLVMGSVGV